MLSDQEFEELTIKIHAWGRDRGLHRNGNAASQVVKAFEEYGELLRDMNLASQGKDVDEELKDDIGDIYVCIVQACGRANIDTQGLVKNWSLTTYKNAILADGAIELIAIHLGRMFRQAKDWETAPTSESKAKLEASCREAVSSIKYLSGCLGLRFDECCSKAYADIKDRKGEMREDGIFYKE